MSEIDTTNGKWSQDKNIQSSIIVDSLYENFGETVVKGVMKFLNLEDTDLLDEEKLQNIIKLLDGK